MTAKLKLEINFTPYLFNSKCQTGANMFEVGYVLCAKVLMKHFKIMCLKSYCNYALPNYPFQLPGCECSYLAEVIQVSQLVNLEPYSCLECCYVFKSVPI